MHRETTPIVGGFNIHGLSDDLIVAVPEELAKHLKQVGIPVKPKSNAVLEARIETALTDFMNEGEIDRNGFHNCVLLDASEEDLEYCRSESQLPNDCPAHEIIRKCPFAAKIFSEWDPKATKVTFDANKRVTWVTFADYEANVLMKVRITDDE